jgi:hypothetical protein
MVEDGKALLLRARGHFPEADAAYSRAEARWRDSAIKFRSWPTSITRWVVFTGAAADFAAANAGNMKSLIGRHAEAEVDVRRALLGRLKWVGKYHSDTASILNIFSYLLLEQARVKEGETLARASIEILDAIAYRHDTNPYVSALTVIGWRPHCSCSSVTTRPKQDTLR